MYEASRFAESLFIIIFMSRKFLFSVALLVGVTVSVLPVEAAEFKSGQSVSLGAAQVISGDLFAAGANVSVDTNVMGDSFLAGSVVRSAGNVSHSLQAAGSIVNVTGAIGHAARIAGSQVTLDSAVEGDVMAAGSIVHILPGTVIKGDLYVAGATITIEGEVKGNVRVAGAHAVIRGTVGGNVLGDVSDLTIASSAKIAGKLEHRGDKDTTIEQGAVVTGGHTFQKMEKSERSHREGNGFFGAILASLFFFLVYLLVALIGNHFFRMRVAGITADVLANFWKKTGWGAIWTFMIPLACFLVLFTVIGIPIGLFGFLAYILLSTISKILAAIILGVWAMNLLDKKRGWMVDWKAIVLGGVLMMIISLIPFIGWAFAAIFMFAAFGGLMSALKAIVK